MPRTSHHIAVVAGLALSIALLGAAVTTSPQIALAAEQAQVEQELDSMVADAKDAVTTVSDCDSLLAAVAAAPTDGTAITIRLDSDIVMTGGGIHVAEGQSIVLDLNGHKITPDDTFTERIIINYGNLVVTGNGTLDASAYSANFGTVENFGTARLENGTYLGNFEPNTANVVSRPGSTLIIDGGDYSNAGTAVMTFGKTIINDGHFETPWYPAFDNSGDATINGGTFVNTSCSACDSVHWAYTIRNGYHDANATMIINGGTVQGVQGGITTVAGSLTINDVNVHVGRCDNGHNASFYALYVAGESYETSCVVNGGTFESADRAALFVGNSLGDGGNEEHATVEVHDGTFIGGANLYVDDELGGLLLDGGEYNLPVDAAFIAADHYVMLRSDGMYEIGTEQGFVKSGAQAYVESTDGTRTYYESLDDAKAAVDGDASLTVTEIRYGITVKTDSPLLTDIDVTVADGVLNGTKLSDLADELSKKEEEIITTLGGGYEFDGWYLDEGLTEPADGDSVVLGGDMTLYPKIAEAPSPSEDEKPGDGEQGANENAGDSGSAAAGDETGDGDGNDVGGAGNGTKGSDGSVDEDATDIMQTGVASVAPIIGVGTVLSGIGALVSMLIGRGGKRSSE